MGVARSLDSIARGAEMSTDTSNAPHYGMDITVNMERASSPIQSGRACPNSSIPVDATQSKIQVQASGEERRPQSSPVEIPGTTEDTRNGRADLDSTALLSAIRQGDSVLYSLSFAELQQLVAEVVREPPFLELVSYYFMSK